MSLELSVSDLMTEGSKRLLGKALVANERQRMRTSAPAGGSDVFNLFEHFELHQSFSI